VEGVRARTRTEARWLALALLAAVLASLAVAPVARAGARRECTLGCRVVQAGCVDDAALAYANARAACEAAGESRGCTRTAKQLRKTAQRACRRYTKKTCKPCCQLGSINECRRSEGVPLAAEPQSGGDPVRGRALLLEGDYMTCGVPAKLWDAGFASFIAGGYGGGADAPRLPERQGRNADLPYFLTAFTSESGAEVLNGNCLMCHGGVFDGELVIGLGNATADFTRGAGGGTPGNLPDEVLDQLGLDAAEKAQFNLIAGRAAALAGRTRMRTIGQNPAELLAVILMVHHDRDTLAWSDEELIPFVIRDRDGEPIGEPLLTSDPPPWWRAHKKNALFYNGMARGDHRGTMALATSVCVDTVARAEAVDAMFRDIQAFVASVRPPAYPRGIDDRLAAAGERLFTRDCAGCHGTYAAREEEETYPNLLIPLDVVGTDPAVAEAGVVHAPELVDWYNGSFYGGITRMEPSDPFPGYMPPPLDGIWATAPYLHNGSVPTIELVLNSRARPRVWRRVDLDSTNFDENAVGWPWIEVPYGQDDAPAAERPFLYDTTKWSQSNGGHPFGDHLTADERRAVLEYLKTL
jgi:mono/diheme cytochrome c family protein